MNKKTMYKYVENSIGTFLSIALLAAVIFLILISVLTVDYLFEILRILRTGINFQKTLIDRFHVNENTATTIITSASIFLGGITVGWISNIIKGVSTRYRYRSMFTRLIKVASKSVMKKSYKFLDCANSLDVTKNENFRMADITLTHLSNIRSIDFKLFHEAFFTGAESLFRFNKSQSAFDSIYSAIDNIERVESRYVDQLQSFNRDYNFYGQRRNDAIKSVKRIIDKMKDEAFGKSIPDEVPHEYDQYLSSIGTIIYTWSKLNNNTLPSVFNEHFIKKIKSQTELSNQSVRVSKFIPNELYYSLNDAANEYESMKNIVEKYNEVFMSYSTSYKSYSRKLYKNANLLEENILSKLGS